MQTIKIKATNHSPKVELTVTGEILPIDLCEISES